MSVTVALRKESVDRNLYYGDDLTYSDGSLSARRAWIEISVRSHPGKPRRSLSARRAWIEILLVYLALIRYLVALRKESVDRNRLVRLLLVSLIWSLSARRAWIEMSG